MRGFQTLLGDFRLKGMMMRYSVFVPRLYNFCLSLGMQRGRIMPSRAFCSDESQGFPVILIAKHFGTFPFNHGLVGGVVATDRHGPHATHGDDLVIIQASHVGYEPETGRFGSYHRIQTASGCSTSNCGKIKGVIEWYLDEFDYARNSVILEPSSVGGHRITIDNQLLREEREEGLFLALDQIVATDEHQQPELARALSTSRTFEATPKLVQSVAGEWPTEDRLPIGRHLRPELFHFKHNYPLYTEGQAHLEHNLIQLMPWIVTSREPALTAAKINTQVEFDRTYRTIVKEHGYQGKNLVFISGLNIDISPAAGQLFPLTKFVPWAAYIQKETGESHTLEQQELYDELIAQSTHNPHQIDLEQAIATMAEAREIRIEGLER